MKSFSKIVIPLTSILKTSVLFQILVTNKILTANEVSSIKNSELTQKIIKSKSRKLSKSQKLAKSKKLSKSGNSTNFSAKETGLRF